MGTYFLAVGIVLVVLVGWVAVQHMARAFAARHPELGAYPEGAGGCGRCGCGSGAGAGKSCRTSAADDK